MTDWIVAFIEGHGYLGIAALMLLENVVPPIPSELIMPFAGFSVAKGHLHFVGVVAAGTVGSLLGTLPWYFAGRALGADRLKRWASRHGRWLTVAADDIDVARRWFDRCGPAAVALGRLIPAVRSVISAPAGVACMSLPTFLLWSAAGSLVWVTALTTLGWALQNHYSEVGAWIDPVAKLVVGAALAVYVWRVVRFGGRNKYSALRSALPTDGQAAEWK